jgi:glycosyltransferase involved in cell wall biosynthesis
MVSFTHKLAAGLERRGIAVTHQLDKLPLRAVLVVGGTRDLPGLWRAKRHGIPIIQRLDGMNWLHRLSGPGGAGLRHYLRAEYGNLLLSFIRSRLADRVIYQSMFSKDWWERKKGQTLTGNHVIHNGVDLELYCPEGPEKPPTDRWRVLMVEGSLLGGYEQGLAVAMHFMQRLAQLLAEQPVPGYPGLLELNIVGRVAEILRNQWDHRIGRSGDPGGFLINWTGLVPPERIPAIDRSAHLFYSSDINPACPNSVIEALACGLPVAAFETGALAELVSEDAGRIVPYGGDPWQLDTPDTNRLAAAALEVLASPDRFRAAARTLAEQLFGLDRMVEAYLGVLLEA